MIIAGLVFAALAALVHVYIFYLESIAWTAPATRKVFGTTAEEAETTKLLAYNQGFYNLFLALLIVIGIVFFAADSEAIGATLVFAGTGSMVAAGLVLIASDRSKSAAARKQLGLPLIGAVLLAIGLAA